MTSTKHAERAHALLSASSAHRWMACTPSAVLESRIPDKGSSYAAEGTLAHEFAEAYLRGGGGLEPALALLRKEPLYTRDMEEYAQDYAAYVRGQVTAADAQIDIETRLDFSRYVPGGFGTGDCAIVQDGVLTIVDFKYGKGVRVSAEKNPQMMLYALGAIEAYDFAFEFDRVRMCIYQPRIDNVSEWELSCEKLEKWAAETLAPKAKLAAKGEGTFQPGDHCQFCKLRDRCKVLAAYCLDAASRDFEDESGTLSAAMLDPWDWNRVLDRIDIVEKWVKTIKEAALKRLLDDPEAIPGYKVVEGRSNRTYRDPAEVETALAEAGYDPEAVHKPRELLGITEMTKVLGKKQFGDILGPLIVKPQGKPTIAPETDKRPAFAPANPELDFENEEENKESA